MARCFSETGVNKRPRPIIWWVPTWSLRCCGAALSSGAQPWGASGPRSSGATSARGCTRRCIFALDAMSNALHFPPDCGTVLLCGTEGAVRASNLWGKNTPSVAKPPPGGARLTEPARAHQVKLSTTRRCLQALRLLLVAQGREGVPRRASATSAGGRAEPGASCAQSGHFLRTPLAPRRLKRRSLTLQRRLCAWPVAVARQCQRSAPCRTATRTPRRPSTRRGETEHSESGGSRLTR